MDELQILKETITRFKDNAVEAYHGAGRDDKQDWERGQIQAYKLVLRQIDEQMGIEDDGTY